ncbi:carbohydrate ABC transporter permease [Ensifer sp. 2YAB10]|uniref:Sugar ABC transporter permease n=1 Tax=Ensifer adhaerens TaxID=106592 RepID=A0A9Q9DDH6_ENSAD|nr:MULTISPECIES: sugar ABC transporter permease [Ensifer]KQX52540.1 ABC transporter permease [Ensifer sp. Root1298]KQX85385.1 ABC transporter permease [Ensifer sp. Root1312]KRC18935.1 ABC transporter permease [Ensifer sp. Root74]KRD76746.1 ABC transporter permease [Ensifer sp. Root954]USJ27743.1 sugar ABC transporter permease [Ensifer adhaerens]
MTLSKRIQAALPALVLSPSLAAIAICVYGFIAYTALLSFTGSKMFARFDFVGWRQYERLFDNPRWITAIENMAIFGGLYVVVATCLGLYIAILIDQKIRLEGVFRAIFLYPMALSFVVTGVIWQWLLNPGLGLEHMVRSLGWQSFTFQWLVDPDWAIYTIVIAGVWQVTGFVMALFLAGLRGVDTEILRAARVDGAPIHKVYTRIVIPALRPVFLTAFVIEAHLAIKSYDLVVALTKGGPGVSTELPSTFMYSMTFTRNELGVGAASATVMLTSLAAIIVPYLYSELRDDRRA